jgi:diguanylate cyclase (GGDEF)-like protein
MTRERRKLRGRNARNKLADTVGLHPRRLSNVDGDVAAALADHIHGANERLENLEKLASVDEMTGTLRRAAGLAALDKEIARAQRSQDGSLAIAFIDLDGLKGVNDNEGHAAGDRFVQLVAATLRRQMRSYDLLIRWGGDEFVAVLPQATIEGASRILNEVESDFATTTGRTFSVGFAVLQDGDTGPSLIDRADAELYERKRQARHRATRPGRYVKRRLGLVAGVAGAAAVWVAVLIANAQPGSALWYPHVLFNSVRALLG